MVTGPHTWAKHYPDAAGKNQSPINIDTSIVKYDPDLQADLKWVATKYEGMKLQNTGRGFRIYMETDAGRENFPFLLFSFRLMEIATPLCVTLLMDDGLHPCSVVSGGGTPKRPHPPPKIGKMLKKTGDIFLDYIL